MAERKRVAQPTVQAQPSASGLRRVLEHRFTVPVLLVLALLAAYSINGDPITGGDSTPNTFLPVYLLRDGTLYFTPSRAAFMFDWTLTLDGKDHAVRPNNLDVRVGGTPLRDFYRSGRLKVTEPDYYIVESKQIDPVTREKEYVSTFGVGVGLSALPVLMWFDPQELLKNPARLWSAAKFAASLEVALSGMFLFLIGRRLVNEWLALLVALAYGLGTCVWTTSSQALFQHAPNVLFLALGTWFLSHQPLKRFSATGCGLAYACALACRPTSSAVLVAVGVYLLLKDRRNVLAFLAGAAPVLLAVGMYNAYFLGAPWDFGQAHAAAVVLAKTGSPSIWQSPLWLGLAGHLLSPSRGLFIFSPFLIAALFGLYRIWREEPYRFARPLMVAMVVILCVEAKHFDWWSGWSYGCRHIVDLTFFLCLFLLPVMAWIARRKWALTLFSLALAWSVVVQVVGAFAYDMVGWNNHLVSAEMKWPGETGTFTVSTWAQEFGSAAQGAQVVKETTLDIDKPENRYRLWSISDNQIGYYLTHFREARQTKRAILKRTIGPG